MNKIITCRLLQDVCVSRMSAGSRLYQGLLGVLSDRLSGLSDLQADLRDLLTHIDKVTLTPDVTSAAPLTPQVLNCDWLLPR